MLGMFMFGAWCWDCLTWSNPLSLFSLHSKHSDVLFSSQYCNHFVFFFFKTWACAKKQITIVCSYWMKWNIKAHLDSIVFVHKSVIISEWVCDFQQQENSNLLLSRSFVHEPASRACGWERERESLKKASTPCFRLSHSIECKYVCCWV